MREIINSVFRMSHQGHLDGGDVLLVDKQFFIGLTSRTDKAGISEFTAAVGRYGYQVTAIEVSAGLHLKSIVNYVGRTIAGLFLKFRSERW